MPRISAGLLMYRSRPDGPQFFLVHPGGPFWVSKDAGAWTIPKGEVIPGEELLACAQREFREETGWELKGNLIPLQPVKQKGGKIVHVWSFEGDGDASAITSNTFTMEWPPRSGRWATFPEVDRAGWFDMAAAYQKINPAQTAFLDELVARLRTTPPRQ